MQVGLVKLGLTRCARRGLASFPVRCQSRRVVACTVPVTLSSPAPLCALQPMEWPHCSHRTVLVTRGAWVMGSDSLSCFCSMCLTTGRETSSAAWLTLAGSLGTATCYMGPCAMEPPVSFLRALQFTLILVRAGNPNGVPGREHRGRHKHRWPVRSIPGEASAATVETI